MSRFGKGKKVYLTQSELQVLSVNMSQLHSRGKTTLDYDPMNVRVLGKSEKDIVGNVLRKVNKHKD